MRINHGVGVGWAVGCIVWERYNGRLGGKAWCFVDFVVVASLRENGGCAEVLSAESEVVWRLSTEA